MKRKILSLLTAMTMLMSLIGIAPTATNAEDITTISTAADLVTFRDSVNGGNTYEGKFIRLTADIDLSGVCGFVDNSGVMVSWTPIGTRDCSFKGTFDGDKHKITGLYISVSDSDNQGLFGVVGSDGEVKNLGVDGRVSGGSNVGGVVGVNNGTVTSCYNTGTVSGSSNVGGIAGLKCGEF